MVRLDFIKLIGAFMTSFGLLRIINGDLAGIFTMICGITIMAAAVGIERSVR